MSENKDKKANTNNSITMNGVLKVALVVCAAYLLIALLKNQDNSMVGGTTPNKVFKLDIPSMS